MKRPARPIRIWVYLGRRIVRIVYHDVGILGTLGMCGNFAPCGDESGRYSVLARRGILRKWKRRDDIGGTIFSLTPLGKRVLAALRGSEYEATMVPMTQGGRFEYRKKATRGLR